MAHQLEIKANGEARMMYAGKPPWHGLGTAVEKEMTWEGAIRIAGLDRWNVQLVPAGAQNFNGQWVEVPGRKAIMRGMDSQVYGMVTDAYEVIQNEEAGAFLESLVGEGLAMFHTAGSLFSGRKVFVSCKLPDSMEIGPDKVDKYLVALWGHDGATAFHIKWTPIRVVCWNTVSAAFDIRNGKVNATDCVGVYHFRNWKDRAAQAREVLDLTTLYYKRVEECFQRLVQTPFRNSDFSTFTKKLYPDTQKEGSKKVDRSVIREKLTTLFHAGIGQDHPDVKNTRWAAYNAVTEYIDHQGKYLTKLDGQDLDVASARMNSIVWGHGAQVKKQALDLLTVA